MARRRGSQAGDLFHTVSLSVDEVDQIRGVKRRIKLYQESQTQPNPTTREERTLYWLLRDVIGTIDQFLPPDPR